MLALSRLASRQLLFLTGKGGVGKSALSAALGLVLAESGRSVLVLEVDPRESLHLLLDVEPSGGRVVPVVDRLFVQNLRPRDVLDALVRERVGFELIAHRVLESAVYQHFAGAAPGFADLAVLGHALRVVRGIAGDDMPTVDLVLLDAPATGHSLSLLAAPRLVTEVVQDGPFGRLAAELAAHVHDPAACGILVATMAEEMPVQEALELIAALAAELAREPDLVIVNALYPEAARASAQGGGAESLWRERRRINERELERLAAAWRGPRLDLPLLALDRGPDLVSALADRIARALDPVP